MLVIAIRVLYGFVRCRSNDLREISTAFDSDVRVTPLQAQYFTPILESSTPAPHHLNPLPLTEKNVMSIKYWELAKGSPTPMERWLTENSSTMPFSMGKQSQAVAYATLEASIRHGYISWGNCRDSTASSLEVEFGTVT